MDESNFAKVFIAHNEGYESFFIENVQDFLEFIKGNLRIARRFKEMNTDEFKQWIDLGVTKKQFLKLQALKRSFDDARRNL